MKALDRLIFMRLTKPVRGQAPLQQIHERPRLSSDSNAQTGEASRHATKDHGGQVLKWDYSFIVG